MCPVSVLHIGIAYADGVVIAEVPNPAVSYETLKQIHSWKVEGLSLDAIIDRLRPCTVPYGYTYCTRIKSKYLHALVYIAQLLDSQFVYIEGLYS